jgi:hypothetical protein
MKNIIFKGTAAQTAKANNAQKIDSKNILDISYILETIASMDISSYENLRFSKSAIIEAFTEKMKSYKDDSYIFVPLKIDRFIINIESAIFRYYVYSTEKNKQIYRYHSADNCRIAIYHDSQRSPVFFETYNPERFTQSYRWTEAEI